MIDAAIATVADRLNGHLKGALGTAEDPVVVSHILETDGSPAANVDNKLAVFLANIEKDTLAQRSPQRAAGGAERIAFVRPSLSFNVYVVIAAVFGGANYPEALKFLSCAIEYLQGNPVFDRRNAPDLDPRLERLALDVHNLDFNDLSNLWGVLTGRYVPSIVYRMRLVTFDSGALTGQAAALSRPEVATRS